MLLGTNQNMFKQKLTSGNKRDFIFYIFLPILHTLIKRFAAAIETLWRFIKYQWLKIKDYANLNSLKQAIRHILRKFGTDYQIDFTMNY